MDAGSFINYYAILDLRPHASPDEIDRGFRHLARRYHPDNQETGDRGRFDSLVEAYDVLRDETKRAKYLEANQHHFPPAPKDEPEPESGGDAQPDDEIGERNAFIDQLGIDRDISVQNNLLIMLYLRRRRNAKEPGIGNAELEYLSGCPHEHLEFHLWYLKAKGWVYTGDDGLLAITVEGVDRAASLYQEHAKKLLTDQTPGAPAA